MRKEKSNIKNPAFVKTTAGRQIAKVFFIILLLLFVFLLKNKNNNSSGLVYADACMTECDSGETSNQGCAAYNCPAGTSRNCVCIGNSDACCSQYPSTCGKGHWSCTCDPDSSCVAPTPTDSPNPPPNPTATPVPPAATATPVPARPALCQSATISSSTLSSGGSLTITSTANTSDIKTFTYAFYNLDNLYGPNNPKPIFFVANTHYVRSDSTTPPVNPPSHSVTINYDEINKQDLNWSSQKPTKIQVNAYFTNSQGGFSLPDARCVVKFNITLASPTATPVPPTNTPTPTSTVPTPTINPACVCGTGDLCDATNCTFNKYTSSDIPGITYNDPLKCSLSPLLFPTPPSDKTSWCRRSMRTKGDADGNGIINTADYFYYVAAVNGGKIPVTANPDFNGDGEVGANDRTIIIKSLNP